MKTLKLFRLLSMIATLVCFCACEKTDHDVQPDIPMYDQLLLKGNVKTIHETIASEFSTHTESYTFDKSGKLVSYSWDGEELELYADLRCIMFPCIAGNYADFVFPEDWAKYDNRTETRTVSVTENGVVTHEVEKEIEYEWDRSSGRFTKVRCYVNNDPVSLAGIENGYNIEEYLYYSNGLPHFGFTFADEAPELYTELAYDEFDENGNPLFISISTPNGDITITRQIEYY